MNQSPRSTTTDLAIYLCSHYPVAGAQALENHPPQEVLEVLEQCAPYILERLLPHIDPTLLTALVSSTDPERFGPVLKAGGAEVCASVLLNLADNLRESFLRALPEDLQERLREYLDFPIGSAGRAMKSDYESLEQNLSVSEVVQKLRKRSSARSAASNVFVVDDQRHLVGVVPMRELVVADPSALLKDFMHRDVVTVGPFDEASAGLQLLSGRGFTTLPVVDAQSRLLGVLRATQLISDAQETASQSIQKLFGVGSTERAFSPITFCLRKRLPWLHVNLATAFLAAAVVALFEDVIARITVLAIYLPVVAGQGGNAGAQSLAVVMRGLVMREIPQDRVRALIFKETAIGLVNGIAIGLITGIIAWVWNQSPYLGIVIALAMVVNLCAAGLAGAAIPVAMKRFGLDPAQSSSIVLTTVTDVVGFFAFLGFALVFQDRLV